MEIHGTGILGLTHLYHIADGTIRSTSEDGMIHGIMATQDGTEDGTILTTITCTHTITDGTEDGIHIGDTTIITYTSVRSRTTTGTAQDTAPEPTEHLQAEYLPEVA